MAESADTCLFSLEVCVDTVDFLGGNTKLSAQEAASEVVCSLAFIFFDYPPIVLNPPLGSSTVSSWYTRKGEKRLRQIYQVGQSVLLEEEPLEIASKLSSQSMMLLAVGPREKNTTKHSVLGSAAISLQTFVPPQTDSAGRHRFGYLRGSWGCSEMVVPLKDYGGNTIALALIVISLSAVDPSLKKFLIQNKTINHEERREPVEHQYYRDDSTQQYKSNVNTVLSSDQSKVPIPHSLNIPSHAPKFKFDTISENSSATSSSATPTSATPTTGQGSLNISWNNTSPEQRQHHSSRAATTSPTKMSQRNMTSVSFESSQDTPKSQRRSEVAVSPNLTPPPSASTAESSSSSSAATSFSSSMNSNLSQSFNHSDRQFSLMQAPLSESGEGVITASHLKPLRSSIGHEEETQLTNSSPASQPSPVWLGGDGEGALPGVRMSASGAGFKQASNRVSGSGIGLGESIDMRNSLRDSFPVGNIESSNQLSQGQMDSTTAIQEGFEDSQKVSTEEMIENSDSTKVLKNHSSGGHISAYQTPYPPLPSYTTMVTLDTQESYHYQPKPLFLSNTDTVPIRHPSHHVVTQPVVLQNQEETVGDKKTLHMLEEKLSRIEAKLNQQQSPSGIRSSRNGQGDGKTSQPTELLREVMNEMSHLGDHSILRKLFAEIAILQADSSSNQSSFKKKMADSSKQVNGLDKKKQEESLDKLRRSRNDQLRLRTLPVRSRPHLHRYKPQGDVITPPPLNTLVEDSQKGRGERERNQEQDDVNDVNEYGAVPLHTMAVQSPLLAPEAPPFTPGIGERMDEWFARNQNEYHEVNAVDYSKVMASEMNHENEEHVLAVCERLFGHDEEGSKLNYVRAMSLLSEVVSGTFT